MSYRVELRTNRKLLVAWLLLLLVVPGLCTGRWNSFGPEGNTQPSAIRADRSDRQLLFLASDHGVFVSRDSGLHWEPNSNGLHGYAVLALEQATSGAWVAGTNHGIFLLPANTGAWRPSETVVNEQGTPRIIHVKGVTRRVMAHHATRAVLQSRVNDIEIAPNRWLAATSSGIFSSSDQGKIWSGGAVNGEKEFIAVKAEKELVAAATRSKVFVSIDGGTVWRQAALSLAARINVYDVVISPDSRIFFATSQGVFRSSNGGVSWEHIKSGLPVQEVGAITFDAQNKRLLAYSDGFVFESRDKGQNWRHLDDIGLGVAKISAIDGRVYAITGRGLLASPDNSQDESQEANRSHGNWFLRLVHKSQ